MLRTLILLAILSIYLPISAQAGDSIYLQFGEWANSSGGGASFHHITDRFHHNPFVKLNGKVVDYMVLYHVAKSDRFTFSLGPVAGFQSKEDGVVPHCGFEVRSRCQLGSFEPSFRFATRHTHKERLHHLFKVWVMRNWDSFSLGLGYQPIRKDGLNDYWNDRVAVTVKVPYKGISFFLEGRTSLREGHRTSMNFDIKIPLN